MHKLFIKGVSGICVMHLNGSLDVCDSSIWCVRGLVYTSLCEMCV